MAAPLPAIHLPSVAARHRLVEDLWALGFRRLSCTLEDAKNEMIGSDSTCIFLDWGGGEAPNICRLPFPTMLGLTRKSYNVGKFTWVNSPSHFIAYIKRSGIESEVDA